MSERRNRRCATLRAAIGAIAAIAASLVNFASVRAEGLKLTRGKGIAVCEAYLQRLRRSHLDGADSPFCRRPEDESIPGFQHLERYDLTEAEALPLVNRVRKFMAVGDQNQVLRTYYSNTEHPELSHWSDDVEMPDGISDYGSRTKVWSYRAPLDVENSGVPLRVLLWQGYPAAAHRGEACGTAAGATAWDLPYIETRAFILAPDGSSIDEAKTRAVFTTPAYVSSLDTPASKVDSEHRVIPIGDSLGVLKYEDRYYIDAADRPASRNSPVTYTVFLRQDGRTKEICTLR